jgi:hypothetical protein
MSTTLEKTPRISPLLSDAVIERDYTQGIESQIGNPQQNFTNTSTQTQSEPIQSQASGPGSGSGAGPSPNDNGFDSPKGFSFEEDASDLSDIQDGDPSGFELASGSAKTFANVIGDLIKIKVPEVTFQFCKVDMNSIEAHILNGNINAGLREPFQNVNIATREALEFSDDEIKMWKKAFKEYLEYKNIKVANPETAFWIATGTLVLTQGIKVVELKKNNKKYIVDAINSYNPSYFESFKAKKNEAPDEPVKETKSEKKAV